MQTWATFSIVDHRQPIYRQALALFDRIVVPIPPKPIGDMTPEELDQLKSEVEYLEKHGAAEPYDWSSESFAEWRAPFLAEAVSAGLNRDIFLDTRIMVAARVASDDVVAVPVYRGQEQYDQARDTLMTVQQALTLQIAQRLPVPEQDVPLEHLVRLRDDPAFRAALESLLEWKSLRAPMIVLGAQQDPASREALFFEAMQQFDRLTKKYAEAMEAQGHKKVRKVVSIFVTALTGNPLGAIQEGLVSFDEIVEPSWKQVAEKKCAPGGVVYHFEEALH